MIKVLIADDEPIERIVVSRLIHKNFEGQLAVIEAVNGREATERFFSEDCSIAILDIEMPGMNGLDAAKAIRAKSRDAIIIFLTAFDEFDYAKKAINVRAMEYLLKPTAEDEMTSVLEQAISELSVEREDETTDQMTAAKTLDASDEEIRLSAIASTIKSYIDTHYMEELSLQDMAGMLHYSDAYFCKIFKQCFDKGFILYLSEYRVEKAKALLADVSINIKDISAMVGYNDSNYFTKVFKRAVGKTPSEYRFDVLGQR